MSVAYRVQVTGRCLCCSGLPQPGLVRRSGAHWWVACAWCPPKPSRLTALYHSKTAFHSAELALWPAGQCHSGTRGLGTTYSHVSKSSLDTVLPRALCREDRLHGRESAVGVGCRVLACRPSDPRQAQPESPPSLGLPPGRGARLWMPEAPLAL